jgi:hypothetical protein
MFSIRVSFEPDSKVSEESSRQQKKQHRERTLTEAGTQIERSDKHAARAVRPSSFSFELDSKATNASDLQGLTEGQ